MTSSCDSVTISDMLENGLIGPLSNKLGLLCPHANKCGCVENALSLPRCPTLLLHFIGSAIIVNSVLLEIFFKSRAEFESLLEPLVLIVELFKVSGLPYFGS